MSSEEFDFFKRVLQWTALPVLGLFFYFAHGYLADFLGDLAYGLPNAEARRFFTLAVSLLAPAVAALAFAYPIAAIFHNHAVAAALFITIPSLKMTFNHALESSGKPLWLAASIVTLVGIGLLVPYAAWRAQLRFRTG